jgi:hypothetical protein
MAEPFDRLLVGQPPEALVEALAEATRAADPSGLRTERDIRVDLRQVERIPEGQWQWEEPHAPGTSYVKLAWWTDHQGGRHYRVCGGNAARGGHRHYSRAEEDPRPSLWHVYPERIFRRTQAGREEWLASCACGATGTPQALAWMGPGCGPCHDRREEGSPVSEAGPATLDFAPRRACTVAFAPDGLALAVSTSGPVFLCDLTTNTRLHLYEQPGDWEVPSLAFAPAGRTLALAEPGMHGVRLLATEETWSGALPSRFPEGQVRQVAFSPDGRTLAALSAGEGLEVWTLPLAHPDEDAARWQQHRATAFAYSPDSTTLAVGREGGRVLLVDATTGAPRRRLDTGETAEETFLALFYTPDGRRLVLVTAPQTPATLAHGSGLRVWDLEQGQQLLHLRLPLLSAVALAPDGRFLAGVADDVRCTPAAVTFWDVADGSVGGTLEWDTEDLLRDLAFAPDGQTLATAAVSGTVKLWPWRHLLGREVRL